MWCISSHIGLYFTQPWVIFHPTLVDFPTNQVGWIFTQGWQCEHTLGYISPNPNPGPSNSHQWPFQSSFNSDYSSRGDLLRSVPLPKNNIFSKIMVIMALTIIFIIVTIHQVRKDDWASLMIIALHNISNFIHPCHALTFMFFLDKCV